MLENSRIGRMLIEKGEKRGIKKGRLLERQKILGKSVGKKHAARSV